jgi:di/tricarboxylate transporter
MTTAQLLAVGIIAAMMVAFVWGRLRYDLVAVLALLAALAAGIVPAEEAFSGFSDDIVIIVGSALLVSAGVARSGITEALVQRFAPNLTTISTQMLLLVGVVTILSAFVKNIGALAIMIPIAFQFARRSKTSPSRFLMPMAFGALLGGLMTQIGTSPNIIVSRVREELSGIPFTMFDFTPVGAALALAGIVFLVIFHRLVPERARKDAVLSEAIEIENYLSEATVTESSGIVGKTVGELLKLSEGTVRVLSILRSDGVRITPLPDGLLHDGDVLLLEGGHGQLDRVVALAKLSVTSERRAPGGVAAGGETEAIEAVIGETSTLVGQSAKRLWLYDTYGVNLLAVSRKGERLQERLGEVRLRLGDVIVLQGNRQALPQALRELGCLPLAERPVLLGSARNGVVPAAILIVAMAATATGTVPVAVAFFAAAVGMILFKAVPVREAYRAIDGPILVMLAALIPVSDSLRRTGATDVMGEWLSHIGAGLPAYGAIALILVAAMAVTPFLNNAATVLVMAPIAAGFAGALGYRPEAFLMAVAIGAGCDFLTPIGHQCNTLVLGPGGYRFGDYARLGAPLSLLVVIVAVPLLLLVWPVG